VICHTLHDCVHSQYVGAIEEMIANTQSNGDMATSISHKERMLTSLLPLGGVAGWLTM